MNKAKAAYGYEMLSATDIWEHTTFLFIDLESGGTKNISFFGTTWKLTCTVRGRVVGNCTLSLLKCENEDFTLPLTVEFSLIVSSAVTLFQNPANALNSHTSSINQLKAENFKLKSEMSTRTFQEIKPQSSAWGIPNVEPAKTNALFLFASSSTNSGIKPSSTLEKKTEQLSDETFEMKQTESSNVSRARSIVQSRQPPLCMLTNTNLLSIATPNEIALPTIAPTNGVAYYAKFSLGDTSEICPIVITNTNTVLCCTIRIHSANKTQRQESINNDVTVADCEFKDNIGHMLESGKFSDVTLVVKGKSISVHKAILSARSKVFANLLDAEKNQIEIDDLEYEVVLDLCKFLYTGEAEHLDIHADDMIVAADTYDLPRLKDQCQEILIEKLNAENACDMLILADKSNAEQLMTASVDFIDLNFIDVKNSASFLSMYQTHPHLLMQILKKYGSKEKSKVRIYRHH